MTIPGAHVSNRGDAGRGVLRGGGCGAEVVARALATPPRLVLLDVLMPGLDGPAVCRRLRAEPRTTGVPLIFYSPRSRPQRSRCGSPSAPTRRSSPSHSSWRGLRRRSGASSPCRWTKRRVCTRYLDNKYPCPTLVVVLCSQTRYSCAPRRAIVSLWYHRTLPRLVIGWAVFDIGRWESGRHGLVEED
jgi:CheY-like chemotaxis protein